ncbi:hypothetical protein DFQ01_11092 [Paenibacillus cellulosilyticus]|uniref:MinD-like ATPase involved in chromosome partitioning or flagellar assembly n=1 Tax=Paenibacillus cellulosilyticus TaxID=375489 RepID=A0A2V2YSK1_9BACL|nr:NAD(P)/FAD-dependent oxidoreductase [Paenibacillus cellulosilyticus]PWW01202.1 hypothetical protein DFQ01_11092 [Paenibacillus cellulosilyticus]
MKWMLVELNTNQLPPPNLTLIQVDNIHEAERSLLVLRPDVIVTHERAGNELLDIVMAMGIQSRVIIVSDQYNAHIVRSWSARGADMVWQSARWEQALLETAMPHTEQVPDMLLTASEKYNRAATGPLIIAVAGAYPGAGVTHAAITIAKYLTRRYKKVALWEANHRPCFELIEYIRTGQRSHRHRFDLEGITYFKASADMEWLESVMDDFEAIVMDVGTLEGSQSSWFFRSQVPLLIGSASEWRQHELVQLCRRFTVRQDRWRIGLPLATEAGKDEIEDLLQGRSVHALPYHPDPFQSQSDTNQTIDEMIGHVMYDSKEKHRRKFLFWGMSE